MLEKITLEGEDTDQPGSARERLWYHLGAPFSSVARLPAALGQTGGDGPRLLAAHGLPQAPAHLGHDLVVAEMRGRLHDGRGEAEFLATAQRIGPYLTLMRGISFEEENIRWAKRALAIIEARQGAGSVR